MIISGIAGHQSFDDSTSVPIGHAVRRFDSFRAAAAQAGISSIYGGIHVPMGNIAGRRLGECVGAKVLQRFRTASSH